ncbi:MAG: hypothetical protein Q9204_006616 [Flavoplaca sp. TL-2023a]
MKQYLVQRKGYHAWANRCYVINTKKVSSLQPRDPIPRHGELKPWMLTAGFGALRASPSTMLLRLLRLKCIFRPFATPNRTGSFINHLQTLRMASTLPKLPVFEAIAKHDPNSTVIIHSNSGRQFTYGQLLGDVAHARDRLRQSAGGQSTDGERVAFLVENSYDYVVTLLSILGSNCIAVPLSSSFPASEIRYILDNSESLLLLSSEKFKSKADEVLREGLEKKPISASIEKKAEGHQSSELVQLEENSDDQSGLMLYTSGTTSRPKGVVLPGSVLTAQSQSLQQPWRYTPNDHLLHVLPLHHIHGTINALLTPLFAGSTIEFLFPFNVQAVWERLAAPFQADDTKKKPKITFLTVVPTIYNRLLSSHSELDEQLQKATKEALLPQNLRLNISGSAALPTPTKSAWTELSGGNVLLERYGMTEVGMALSCGLSFADRIDGSVGWPLPSVEARLVDTETGQIIPEPTSSDPSHSGEIQLRGPTIFKEYWRNPGATAEEFIESEDGKGKWFKTGDVASRKWVEGAGKSEQEWARGPMWFIEGRKSVDIIKTGGEKVSALEVERELLSLPQISEAAVLGLPSPQWGQKVVAIVVLNPSSPQSPSQSPSQSRSPSPTRRAGKGGFSVMDMRRALKPRLAAYKIPQEMRVLEALPKNAMGKGIG